MPSQAGARIAVLSPSSGLPGLFPRPHELGLERLREEYGLEPVEYPATRRMGSTPGERAADLHAAFAAPGIKAVIASIGGDDQITDTAAGPGVDPRPPEAVLRDERQHQPPRVPP